MKEKEIVTSEGEVLEMLPNASFIVKLDSGHEILATLGGKLRLHKISVLAGDRVEVEMSVYDLSKGRITFRKNPMRDSQA